MLGVKGVAKVSTAQTTAKKGEFFPRSLHVGDLKLQLRWPRMLGRRSAKPHKNTNFDAASKTINEAGMGNSFFRILAANVSCKDLISLIRYHPDVYFSFHQRNFHQMKSPNVRAWERDAIVQREGSEISATRGGRGGVLNQTMRASRRRSV